LAADLRAAAVAGGALWLYLRFAATHFRAQMQYPSALVLQIVGTALITAVEFVGVWALLDRFGNVRGWELAEVAVLYGLVAVGFSTAEATGRGFDTFHRQVQRGDFDRILLRPRHTVLQVAGADFAFHRAGRWLYGAVILVWGLVNAGIAWSPARIILLAETIAGVTVLFLGVFVATAAVTFWTVQSLELLAIVSNGSMDAASYPATVYRRFMRRFLFYIVPIGTVTYFPVAALLGRPDPLGTPEWFGWVAPAAAPLFLAASFLLWRWGTRHYTSTGS
jgi:ABC-2 type transport system permease protein